MFRFTIRDVLWLMMVAAIARGMYAAWQADRALLALRLSQMQVRAMTAEESATLTIERATTSGFDKRGGKQTETKETKKGR